MFGRHAAEHYVATVTVVVLLGVYLGEWCIYHVVCTPSVGWAVLFNCVLCLAVWSYLAAALTDPGTFRSPEWQAWSYQRGQEQEAAAGLTAEPDGERPRAPRGWAPGEVTWCRQCSRERPERAHHCGQCNLCVLRMDHHCPWIGNCVGWRNHKYFLLVNWWSFWTCLSFLLTLRRPSAGAALGLSLPMLADLNLVPTAGVIVAFVFLLITGGMFLFALCMALRNITAVEDTFLDANPYRDASSLQNARQLLGPIDLRLLLPLPPSDRPNGTSFQVATKPHATPVAEHCADAGSVGGKADRDSGADAAGGDMGRAAAAASAYGSL